MRFIRMAMRPCVFATITAGFVGSALHAQTATVTGSIRGIVKENNGATVNYALITAVPAGRSGNATNTAIIARVPTAKDGTFFLNSVHPGTYILCAQVPETVYGKNADHFVESCLWQDASTPKITLSAGQALTGTVITLTRGQTINVRINDPGKLLPPPTTKHSGALLQVRVTGPSGLSRQLPILAANATTRSHAIVIPYSLSHKLTVQSGTFALSDGQGRPISGVSTASVVAAPGSAPTSYTFNVIGKVKP